MASASSEAAKTDPTIAIPYTGHTRSFAYGTARKRWPIIFDTILAELDRAIGTHAIESEVRSGLEIRAKIVTLKDHIAADGLVEALHADSTYAIFPGSRETDINDYNAELATYDSPPTWLNAPWLFVECLLYRLIHSYFLISTPQWRNFDVFHSSKWRSLVDSRRGVLELVKRHGDLLDADTTALQSKDLFTEMLQISLWGNATDLSLLTTASVDDLDSRQGRAAREKSLANVLVDDTGAVWDALNRRNENGEIHVVLDNAGFELLADLVLVSYFLISGLAQRVVLHGKKIPWFVSDVTKVDLEELVDALAIGELYKGMAEADVRILQRSGAHWRDILSTGKVEFRDEVFWTTQHPVGRMPLIDAALWTSLCRADLVVYKGDLNYRKLTYDGEWPRTTSFKEAIGPLGQQQNGAGMKTLALRTAKADVAVGLGPGVAATLPSDWTFSGKYAMISYVDANL